MFKNIHIWIFSYLKKSLVKLPKPRKPIDIMFCFVDHFEPRVGGVDKTREVSRVRIWTQKYLEVVNKHKDWQGRYPQHTFFYPIDEYTPEVLKIISDFCELGYGEVELHLHHDNDTPQSLKKILEYAKKVFCEYGLLSRDKLTGELRYGFIHGNWALDNSRRDGKWCGVNNELAILSGTGCYADFTLPSWPSETQTKKINSIYYARDTRLSKSHNTGIDVKVGSKQEGDLMLIQGPLALNWRKKKLGIFPKVENGEISLINPPTAERIDLWINQNISVKGKPEWVFVKIHTHGAKDDNLKNEFFSGIDFMFDYLEKNYNDGINYRLHYLTAREMYNIIKAAEDNRDGSPQNYKDYVLERNVGKKGEKVN